MRYKESKLAHKYLDGLHGLEIGGAAHNSFGLNTKNVDYTKNMNTAHKKEEEKMCGKKMSVDIEAPGDCLPLKSKSVDFVISSHVLEHFPDPIKALKEWYRVVRYGGYIFMIIPHKKRTFDKDQERTTLGELISRYENASSDLVDNNRHFSV